MSALLLMALNGQSAGAQAFFQDGFESGDLSHSENGFRWLKPNRTSIVRDDQYRVWYSGNSVEDGPYEGRQWENAPSSSGRHALRFSYPAGVSQSEQRFSLGSAHPELWLSFSLRVPINFSHPNTHPSNQKLLAVWMDQYEGFGDGSTVFLGFWNDGSGGSNFAVTNSNGRYTGGRSYQGNTQFISVPEDRGRWMQLVVRMKAESREDAADGTIEVWRRWEGFDEFEKTHNLAGRTIRVPAQGPQGFAAGYVLGWANAAYEVDTEFLVDDFVVSTDSLLSIALLPAAPNQISVE